MDILGYKIITKEEHERLEGDVLYQRALATEFREKAQKYDKENFELRKRLKKQSDEELPFVSPDTADPEPSEGEVRLQYAGRVASFFAEIGKPKLMAMIASAHRLMENPANSVKFDDILKGYLRAYWTLIGWAEGLQEEIVQSQIDATEKSDDDLRATLEEFMYR